uniref:Acetylserotonin O-methyltransferase n=1 Tax=Rhinopithecus roxellana TaxID=61622 RepID=A0A2K6NCC8_RHIRO
MGSSGDDGYRLLNEYANGFMVSQVLFAACELGVFDLLAEAPGPLDVAAVAAGVEASSHGTELLLDTCVSLKLLKVETRAGKAFYENTELSSAYLTRVSPTSQCSLLKYLGRTSYGCWGHLADAVREGKNQYLETFGVPAEDLFTAIYRSEGERLQFMRALQDVWSVNGRSVLTAFDLSGFPRMCDLGGGGILVIESLLDEDRRGPLLTQLYSLNMLVQTEGQERTPTHYHMLLSSAGFRDFQFKKTGAIYDAVLVRK